MNINKENIFIEDAESVIPTEKPMTPNPLLKKNADQQRRKSSRASLGRRVSFASSLQEVREFNVVQEEWHSPPSSRKDPTTAFPKNAASPALLVSAVQLMPTTDDNTMHFAVPQAMEVETTKATAAAAAAATSTSTSTSTSTTSTELAAAATPQTGIAADGDTVHLQQNMDVSVIEVDQAEETVRFSFGGPVSAMMVMDDNDEEDAGAGANNSENAMQDEMDISEPAIADIDATVREEDTMEVTAAVPTMVAFQSLRDSLISAKTGVAAATAKSNHIGNIQIPAATNQTIYEDSTMNISEALGSPVPAADRTVRFSIGPGADAMDLTELIPNGRDSVGGRLLPVRSATPKRQGRGRQSSVGAAAERTIRLSEAMDFEEEIEAMRQQEQQQQRQRHQPGTPMLLPMGAMAVSAKKTAGEAGDGNTTTCVCRDMSMDMSVEAVATPSMGASNSATRKPALSLEDLDVTPAPAQTAQAAPLTVSSLGEFLEAIQVGIADTKRSRGRKSSVAIPRKNAFGEDKLGYDLQARIRNTVVNFPVCECLRWANDELKNVTTETLDAIEQITAEISALDPKPTVFQRVGDPRLQAALKDLKEYASRQAHLIWYSWRTKIECVILERMNDAKEVVPRDIDLLEALLRTVAENTKKVDEDIARQQLIFSEKQAASAQADQQCVVEYRAEIEQLETQTTALRTRCAHLEVRWDELCREGDSIQGELGRISQTSTQLQTHQEAQRTREGLVRLLEKAESQEAYMNLLEATAKNVKMTTLTACRVEMTVGGMAGISVGMSAEGAVVSATAEALVASHEAVALADKLRGYVERRTRSRRDIAALVQYADLFYARCRQRFLGESGR